MTAASLVLRRMVLLLIRFYQRTLSIDHGLARYLVPASGRCRWYPSCSEYGYRAVERFGVVRGGFLAVRRVLRCHPFARGGVDDVPEAKG